MEKHWGRKDVSFWLTVLVCIALLFIGFRFVLAPKSGAAGYGIPIANDFVYGQIKGFRDMIMGLTLIPFLIKCQRLNCGVIVAIYVIEPLSDALVVYFHSTAVPSRFLYMHSGMTVFMIVLAFVLLKKPKS